MVMHQISRLANFHHLFFIWSVAFGDFLFCFVQEPRHRGEDAKDDSFSECAQRGKAGEGPGDWNTCNSTLPSHLVLENLWSLHLIDILVKPKRGNALLFFSLHPDATTDQGSLHAGCPVIEGEKWSATKWIHVASFDKIITSQGNCTDENESCERWAALGECTKNPEYMVGTADLAGFCRRSCNVC